MVASDWSDKLIEKLKHFVDASRHYHVTIAGT